MLFVNAILIVETFIAFVIAITLHEAAHAAMATLLGDATPSSDGRLTASPRQQMAGIGTIVAIVSCMAFLPALPGGLGWGKPVDIDARRLRVGPNFGSILVALAGPLMNAFLGVAISFGLLLIPGFHRLGLATLRCGNGSFGGPLQDCLSQAQPWYVIRIEQFLLAFAVTNILIALLNIIPLHPLDGYRVLYALLPTRQALSFRNFEPYMELTLLVIFFVIPWILSFVHLFTFNPSGLLISAANNIVGGIVGSFGGTYFLL